MLSYPLGAHISAPKKRKPKKTRPPSPTYVVTIHVYTDDRGRQRERVMLAVPNEATVADVVALVWERMGRVNPRRGAHEYTLMQCHADGDIDESLPFLAHDGEAKAQLGFPYMAVCCLSPFLIKLEAVVRKEAAVRSEICVQHTGADAWLYTYSLLLQRIRGFCKAIRREEADERRRLAMQARAEKYAVLRQLLAAEEVCARATVEGEFTVGLDLIFKAQELMHVEIGARVEISEEFTAGMHAMRAALSEVEYEHLLLKAMHERNAELLRNTAEIYETYSQSQRMLYNLSRIHVNVVAAQDVHTTPYAFHHMRVKLHKPAYELPPKRPSLVAIHADSIRRPVGTALDLRRNRHALTLPDVLLDDHYTSSWPTLQRNEIAPRRARLENLEPHLRPGGLSAIHFRKW